MVRDVKALMDRLPSGVVWVAGEVAQDILVRAVTAPGSPLRTAYTIYDTVHIAHDVFEFGRDHGCVSLENGKQYWDLGCTIRAATR